MVLCPLGLYEALWVNISASHMKVFYSEIGRGKSVFGLQLSAPRCTEGCAQVVGRWLAAATSSHVPCRVATARRAGKGRSTCKMTQERKLNHPIAFRIFNPKTSPCLGIGDGQEPLQSCERAEGGTTRAGERGTSLAVLL